jgi:predicted MFS family arabinose efflux permease
MNAGIFRSPNYRAYVVSGSVAAIGGWLYKSAIGWYLYEQSQSASVVAMLAMADAVPFLLCSLHAGVLADRIHAKLQAWRACFLGQAAAFIVLGVGLALDVPTYGLIYTCVAVSSLLQTLQVPLGQVVIRSCFDRNEQMSMASTNSIINNVARFAGAWFGVVAYRYSGIEGVVLINAASFLIPYLVLRKLVRVNDVSTVEAHASAFSLLIEGFRYVGRDRALRRSFMLLVCTCLLGRPIVEQIPSIAALSVDASLQAASQLVAAVGVGSLMAGLLLHSLSLRLSAEWVSVCGAFGIAAASLAISLSMGTWLVPVSFALLGFSMVSHGASMIAFLQQSSRGEYLGRVFSIFNLILRGGVALGAIALGSMFDRSAVLPALYATALVIGIGAAFAVLARIQTDSTAVPHA